VWHKDEAKPSSRQKEDSKSASNPPGVEPAAAPKVEAVRSIANQTVELVQPAGGVLTSTMVIKGEIRGREDLYVDGEVQGSIRLGDAKVTVGPHGRVTADIEAREIIVRGSVQGKLLGSDRVEIGPTGDVQGDVVTRRIALEDGARIKGSVEVTRAEEPRSAGAPKAAAESSSLQATSAHAQGS